MRAHQIGSKREALRAKSSSSVRREPPRRPKSATRSAHSPTQRGATGAHYKTQRRRRVANSPLPTLRRRHRKPPPRGSCRPLAPICGVLERPNLPRSTAVRVPCPPAALALPRQVAVEQPLLAPRRQQQPRGIRTVPDPHQISIVDSLILRPES